MDFVVFVFSNSLRLRHGFFFERIIRLRRRAGFGWIVRDDHYYGKMDGLQHLAHLRQPIDDYIGA